VDVEERLMIVTSPPHSSGIEPVAIVGMGCRFAPDLDSPEKYWQFLKDERDAVREIPPKRWEPYSSSSPEVGAVLRRTTRWGCFLDDIEGFDAGFFGISPREAASVDPQQRILLEATWESLEHAGIPPTSLRGADVGVFVAANSFDYAQRLMGDLPRMEAWALNGGMFFGLANRISYTLDLRGPSLAVDTACAGSLTALHLACQALRQREAPLAIVAGVNVMAGPGPIVALDAAGATAPDGRSKAFDKSANGYGRGEGTGVVVLKRLSDAHRDGDRVLALILGSCVSQDGRTGGMWAPNREAQEHMMLELYRRIDISPRSVAYVEAHGTGTPIGDQVEAAALSRVYGDGRPEDQPCLIGSVKPNIGHLEAAAGVAGVIKTVLALQHGELPPSLHAELNPAIDWGRSGLKVVPSLTSWPDCRWPRRAAVSSYGMGGTIAHTVLEQAPEPEPGVAVPDGADRAQVFPLSAASEAGLRALAGKIADWLDQHPDISPASVGYTLARRRTHLGHRAAIVARGIDDLTALLHKLTNGEYSRAITTALAAAPAAGLHPVWVFSGHGAQWPGMGRQLLEQEPAFAAVMDTLEPIFRSELGFSPREAIAEGKWSTTCRVQAMTFAMQVGLAKTWREHGVRPGAVIGHSVGEIAAAVAAGALDLCEAARFACRRAALLQKLAGEGGMAMVGLSYAETRDRLGQRSDVVAAIAAAPASTVISGDTAALDSIVTEWSREGVAVQRVNADVAFHSPQTDTLLDDLASAATELTACTPEVILYSTALDDPRTTTARDRDYWVANMRNPVRFADTVEAAVADGHRTFLEVSSHPIVIHSINETLAHLQIDDVTVGYSLRQGAPERETMLTSLANLHCHGSAVDWAHLYPDGALADLPTMAWQHRPYWISSPPRKAAGGGGHAPDTHTLLGARTTVSGAQPTHVWETYLDFACRPYPGRHPVHEVEIIPAGVLINTLLHAATHDDRLPALTDVNLRIPVAVTEPRIVQIVQHGDSMRIASRLLDDGGELDDDQVWITHTTAVADSHPTSDPGHIDDPSALRGRCREVWPWSEIEEDFRRRGVGGYGFPWRVEEVRKGDGELFAAVTIRLEPTEHTGSWAELLDGALTFTPTLMPDDDTLRMPAHIRALTVYGVPPSRILVHAKLAAHSAGDTVDVHIADESGRIVAEVTGLRFGVLQGKPGSVTAPRQLVHELAWRPLVHDDGHAAALPESVVLVSEDRDRLAPLINDLERAGVRCRTAATPEHLTSALTAGGGAIMVAPPPALDGETPEDAAERCVWSLISTAKALAEAAESATSGWRLWCLTQGVRDNADEASLAHAPLWGAARVIAGEHPEIWGGVIDVEPGTPALGGRLLSVVRAASREDVVALSHDEDLVARLSPVPVENDAVQSEVSCRADGTYLITGGLGSLGVETARWLVSRGARRLILVGRTGLPPRGTWKSTTDERVRHQIEAILALEALGVTVRVLALDISDPRQVAAALDPAALELPPIRGVVHAAGVTRDARVRHTDRPSLATVMGPKVHGAMTLHRLFPPGTLDFLVLFSSCGQFARLTGQTSYAAANSFLDALATHRAAKYGTETVSIGWTGWREMGLGTHTTAAMEAEARGIGTISATEAFAAWRLAERVRRPYVAVLRALPVATGVERLLALSELSPVDTGDDSRHASAGPADWSGLSTVELRAKVTEDVREQIASVLKLAPADLELKHPLTELGMDSVMTVALRLNMQRRYGMEFPPTILWNRPTVDALAAQVFERIAGDRVTEAQGGDAA
jgi:acyl transferase domain-containing protein/NAD(P)-dependent dehydrogenase (short-subunit alcohol dehydrogenase family)/acyl carrier protein